MQKAERSQHPKVSFADMGLVLSDPRGAVAPGVEFRESQRGTSDGVPSSFVPDAFVAICSVNFEKSIIRA